MMLTIAHTKAGPLSRAHDSAALRRLGATLAAVALWPVRIVRARELALTFANMDDHDLADIGLTRQDVRDATGLSIREDPSLFLAERRRAGRGDLAHHRIPPAWR